MSNLWTISWRCDPQGREIADKHYNRQSVGHQDFAPPGRCLVLKCEGAVWITSFPFSEYVHHMWAGAWVNSLFRREPNCPHRASDLIRSAVAATRWKWDTPELGMITFVDATKVRRKRDPGRCYRRAGFEHVGYTKKQKLYALQLLPEDMPAPMAPMGTNYDLFSPHAG